MPLHLNRYSLPSTSFLFLLMLCCASFGPTYRFQLIWKYSSSKTHNSRPADIPLSQHQKLGDRGHWLHHLRAHVWEARPSAKKSRIYLALHCQRKAAGNAKCRQDGDTFAWDGIRGFVDCKIRQIGARLQRSAERDDLSRGTTSEASYYRSMCTVWCITLLQAFQGGICLSRHTI